MIEYPFFEFNVFFFSHFGEIWRPKQIATYHSLLPTNLPPHYLLPISYSLLPTYQPASTTYQLPPTTYQATTD
jgi:hypothetical protein